MRKNGKLPWLRPDAKSQCTFRYENDKPVGIDAVVLSTQHSPDISLKDLQEAVMEEIIKPVLPAKWLNKSTQYHVNPTGRFVDRRTAWATAASRAARSSSTRTAASRRHGGGAFSGKDPSKVDRSAAYAARYVAKNVVAAGLAERCEVQVSYAIGVAKPTSVTVETFGTNKVPEEKIIAAVNKNFDLRPYGDRQDARPTQARVLEDGLLRPLRSRRLQLGEDGPRGRAESGREVASLEHGASFSEAPFLTNDFLGRTEGCRR